MNYIPPRDAFGNHFFSGYFDTPTDSKKHLPFKGKFEYCDGGFIQTQIGKLIPKKQFLDDFIEIDEDDQNKVRSIILANYLLNNPVPENLDTFLPLKEGISEKAYEHILYLSSTSFLNLAPEILNIQDGDEIDNWAIIVLAVCIYNWLDINDISKISLEWFLFNPNLIQSFNEKNLKVMEYFLAHENLLTFCNRLGNDELNVKLTKAGLILNKLKLYGGNSEFYKSLIFHPSLPPISTFEVISKYMLDKSPEGIEITSSLLSVYMSNESLDNCLETLK